MTKHDSNPDHDPANDNGGDNDNGAGATAPAPAGGALTALATLELMLNKVDVASVAGRSGLPMMQFKARENNGTWVFGVRRTVPEGDSRWAANPTTFQYGYVAFNGNKVVGERLVSVSKEKPDITKLPDIGFPWQEEWAVNLKCLDGADAGTEVVFKTDTNGGIQAVVGLLNTVRDRLNDGRHDGKVSPIMLLAKDSYLHPEYGRTWKPILDIVDWMPLSGPAPEPAPTPGPTPGPTPPAEQARRRRVG